MNDLDNNVVSDIVSENEEVLTEVRAEAEAPAEAEVLAETEVRAEAEAPADVEFEEDGFSEDVEPDAEDDVAEEAADLVEEDADMADDNATDVAEEVPVKRHGWTWVTTLVVVVAAVLVLGMLGFLGYHEGWFDALKPKAKSVCEVGDYSRIEVLSSETTVSDEMVQDLIDSLMEDYPGEEFDDDWVKKFASDVLQNDMQTTEEFREFAYDYIHDYYLHTSMMNYMRSITEVKSYDEDTLAALMAYSEEGISYYAASYGVSPEDMAKYSGYESLEDYERSEAENYMKSIMMLEKVMKNEGLSYTEEDVDKDMLVYMHINGLATMYSLEEFKELSGETWCYLYEHVQFRANLVMTALEDNVVYLEDTPE